MLADNDPRRLALVRKPLLLLRRMDEQQGALVPGDDFGEKVDDAHSGIDRNFDLLPQFEVFELRQFNIDQIAFHIR